MPSLKIKTFNVQMMTKLMSKGKFDFGELFETDLFADKLSRLKAALLSEPVADVLVLNEVFSEEAKGQLVNVLAPLYQYIEPSFGPTGTVDLIINYGKLDDSGLMLFSKWAYQVLAFEHFKDAAGADALAMKGVGIVRIQSQPREVVLAVTHLQADGEAIRNRQVAAIHNALHNRLGSALQESHIVLAGDLNIVGNPPNRPEWETVFQTDPQLFADLFTDCWDKYMPAEDSGLSNPPERLDYILLNKKPNDRLVAQHMRVLHRGASDHLAVWADVNLESPCCTPADAAQVTPAAPQWCGYEMMSYNHSGSMQWARFDMPGSYVFTQPQDTELQIYEAQNISEPLPDFDRKLVDLKEVPGSELAWKEADLPAVGRKFHVPNAPFFVRLTHKAQLAQPTRFGWKLCRGRSPFDAITLMSHHDPTDYQWTADAPVEEEAWFEVFICKSVDGQQHTSVFYADNPSGEEIRLRIKDANEVVLLDGGRTNAAHAELSFKDKGDRRVYFTVERYSAVVQTFKAGWRTELTFLMGPRESNGQNTHKLGLFCVDETGIDWLGGDEIVLRLFIHSALLFLFPVDRAQWDADTDDLEYFPIQPIPYIDGMTFEVRELESVVPDDVGGAPIAPLDPLDKGDDPNSTSAARHLRVKVGSGEYELRYSLGRSPVGGSPNGIA